MFSLETIIALSLERGDSAIFLSAQSKVLIVAALSVMEELSNWQGAGYELTASEIDTIQAMVAQAVGEMFDE